MDSDVKNPTIQCGEELYATASTDRGHLTRYLDVAWGDTPDEAIRAVNDTFHFSNCCLELSGFNQGKDRWQGIEQYLLEKKARKEKRRMAVFTGPIFKSSDNMYHNKFMTYSVRIPLRFWKVCVLERADGTLSATGFVLDQEDITKLPGFEEKFDVTAAQVTLAELENRTGLDFGSLKQHDHFAAGGTPGSLELAGAAGPAHLKPIQDYSEIVV
jgi:endonuclease G